MKKLLLVLLLVVTVFLTNGSVIAKSDKNCGECTTIQSGTLLNSTI
jgi:hypothetical protein